MWEQIIKNDVLFNLVKEKLNEISITLQKINDSNCSLLSGQPGIILFKSYYSKLMQINNYDSEKNVQILFDYFKQPDSLNYSGGIAGVLYTLHHLEKEDFFDFDDNIKNFDYSFFENYITEEETLDYLHGSSGVVLSLLEQNIDAKYNYLFDKWINSISKIREEDNKNLKWKIDLKIEDNTIKKGYCLGLAHGFPSILIILLKLYKRTKSDNILNYINQTINFLLKHQIKDNTDFYFPSQIIDNKELAGQISWCYGDLGVAFALFLSGKQLDDPKLITLAIDVFTKHASKRDYDTYRIIDADFCHGSVGIAHIYARMYGYTNIEIFRETSEYWYQVTIEKAIYPDGLAGYKHAQGPINPAVNEHGLLEGISGIGLSLISAISSIEPKWDNSFLLS